MRRVSVSVVKIFRPIIAIGLLAILIVNLQHANFLQKLAAAKFAFILAAFAMVILDGLVRAWNWTQLIRAMHPGREAPYGTVLTLYWAGSFMGHFLPSTAGTDALRAMMAANKIGGPVSGHGAGVVMLNLISLVTGCAGGLLGMIWLAVTTQGQGVRLVVIALFAAPIVVASVAYWLLREHRWLVLRLLRLLRGPLRKLRRGLRRFMDRMLVFERLDVKAGPIFAISVLTLLTRASVYALVGRAVGLALPAPAWIALVPGYALSGLIPYSVSGYGGDQAAIVYLLTGFGAAAGAALAFALIVPLFTMFFNMLGGFMLLFGKVGTPAAMASASAAQSDE